MIGLNKPKIGVEEIRNGHGPQLIIITNMKAKEIKIGKWYFLNNWGLSYGLKGKCIEVIGDTVILSFYNIYPWRTNQAVEASRIQSECSAPSYFSNL